MYIKDALSLLGLGTIENVTFEQAQKAYRRACMKYHPDRNPAGEQMMKFITEAWRFLEEKLKGSEDNTVKNDGAGEEKQAADFGETLNQAINAIIDLEGLELTICGAWLWVGGDTRTHKDTLKSAGFRWANKKKMWSFRPENWKSSNRSGEWSFDDIKNKYGSQKPQRKKKRQGKALEEEARSKAA